MNPLEALGWVLTAAFASLAFYGLARGMVRKRGTVLCGAAGPYKLTCQRAPHPTEPAAHAAVDDIDDETSRLVKW